MKPLLIYKILVSDTHLLRIPSVMSSPRYLDKNSLPNSNAHAQNGINSKKSIHVRLLQDSDQAQVRELFKTSMMTGGTALSSTQFTKAKSFTDASPFESTMKAQLKSPIAFVSYFMIMFGTIMATRSTHPMSTLGFSIMAFTGCILNLLYRRYLKAAFIGFLKQSFEGDLADIPKHYKLAGSGEPNEKTQGLRPIAKSGFWVAELVDEGGSEPTIVGCLGLGTSSARLTSDALFNSATA